MFDEILGYLLNEDTSGYPDPENLEYRGYTLEAAVEDMLYDCLKYAKNPYAKEVVIDLINALDRGDTSWYDLMKQMENFEE